MVSWLPFLFYLGAAILYFTHFARRDRRAGRLATGLLAGGVLAHTFLIGMQTVEAGHAPLVGTTAAVSAFVWLLGLSYLYVELTTDERAMGVFVSAILAGLAVLPAFSPDLEPRPPLLQSPLFSGHSIGIIHKSIQFFLGRCPRRRRNRRWLNSPKYL